MVFQRTLSLLFIAIDCIIRINFALAIFTSILGYQAYLVLQVLGTPLAIFFLTIIYSRDNAIGFLEGRLRIIHPPTMAKS